MAFRTEGNENMKKYVLDQLAGCSHVSVESVNHNLAYSAYGELDKERVVEIYATIRLHKGIAKVKLTLDISELDKIKEIL